MIQILEDEDLQGALRLDAFAMLKQAIKQNLDEDLSQVFHDYTKNKDSGLLL